MLNKPLESFVERKFEKFVKDTGGYCVKIEKKHWPDRVMFTNDGGHFFIEFKRQGEKPKIGQLEIHRRLRESGHSVYVCDSFEEAVEIYGGATV